ncbi:MAG TPA: cytochrome c oxidase subunit 3 [Gaiellaceae bacterium]|nr:cytochrome c oxidase subunit 3 [Gaiellaceae bacterium]
MSAGDFIAGQRRIGDVPRTTAAADRAAVSRVLARRTGPPSAWWGMVMLFTSEGMLFAAFIGTFFYLRFNNAHWPRLGDPEPKVIVPIILVAVLSTTSFLMQGAWRAARNGVLGTTRVLIATALVVQSGYFAYEVYDFADELKKMPVDRDAYSSIHYVLLGADHGHVFVGLLFYVWLLWKLARGLTTYRANALQAITWYTHFVNILTWIVIGAITSAAVG